MQEWMLSIMALPRDARQVCDLPKDHTRESAGL
jgi:hypothetical protein